MICSPEDTVVVVVHSEELCAGTQWSQYSKYFVTDATATRPLESTQRSLDLLCRGHGLLSLPTLVVLAPAAAWDTLGRLILAMQVLLLEGWTSGLQCRGLWGLPRQLLIDPGRPTTAACQNEGSPDPQAQSSADVVGALGCPLFDKPQGCRAGHCITPQRRGSGQHLALQRQNGAW